ncbi:MAG TPA: hypothetical protein VJ508_12595, partial [Saprospiraceae bacterium]|nr:hypothetical protein [Saprospiraceae bacterium]
MKTIIFLLTLLSALTLSAQKGITTQTSNLNLSKSNINRLIYPSSIATQDKMDLLLSELDGKGQLDSVALKKWLVANFNRFRIDGSKVKQITILTGRQFEDCTICKKNCKGRCVQDPGSDCVCYQHSEPNLRMAAPQKTFNVILLSEQATDEVTALNQVELAMKAMKP